MSVGKAVAGVVSAIGGLYAVSQIHIPAPSEAVTNTVVTAAATGAAADTSGIAGLLTAAITLSAVGAVVAKLKSLF